jgi:tRNA(Ile)-lysidine synthase TilS/MesJ
LPDVAETLQEDLEFNTELEDKDADDSDVSMQTLITALTREDIPETVSGQHQIHSGILMRALQEDATNMLRGIKD